MDSNGISISKDWNYFQVRNKAFQSARDVAHSLKIENIQKFLESMHKKQTSNKFQKVKFVGFQKSLTTKQYKAY